MKNVRNNLMEIKNAKYRTLSRVNPYHMLCGKLTRKYGFFFKCGSRVKFQKGEKELMDNRSLP